MDALRILILDDEPLILSALRRTMRGHVVIGVEDPEVALALIDGDFIDGVLCDGHMPLMSGEEFAAAVEERGFPADRVALMTGDYLLADRLASDGHRVLEKPLMSEHLQALLEAWRNLRAHSRPPASL